MVTVEAAGDQLRAAAAVDPRTATGDETADTASQEQVAEVEQMYLEIHSGSRQHSAQETTDSRRHHHHQRATGGAASSCRQQQCSQALAIAGGGRHSRRQ